LKDTKVINMFGAPGAGKSTAASGLFSLLKMEDVDVEVVCEYAKKCVWNNRSETLNDQLYITAKQNHELQILKGKVDFIITDSPLLLGMLYKPTDTVSCFNELALSLFNSYNNLNFFINRTKPYKAKGRLQTEQQSNHISKQLKDLLDDINIPYIEIDGDRNVSVNILKHLTKELWNGNKEEEKEDFEQFRVDTFTKRNELHSGLGGSFKPEF
jgi:hypothetical protein